MSSLLLEQKPYKTLLSIAHNQSQSLQTCTGQCRARLAPSPPGLKHLNLARLVSLARLEEKPKLEPRASACLTPPSTSPPFATSRPCLAFHAERSNSFIKLPLSTPHRGFRHCKKRWSLAEKNQKSSKGAADEPGEGLPACGGEMFWRGAPAFTETPGSWQFQRRDGTESEAGRTSLESPADQAGRGMERSRHPWTTRALLCPKEGDPDFDPRENGERGDRTPERAGADCHWLPPPSAATMAGHSLPSMTSAAVVDPASPVLRLRCPDRRHPQRLGAEGGSAEKTARAPPPTIPRPESGKAVTWRAGWTGIRPRGGRWGGRGWPPAQGDLGNLEDLFRTGWQLFAAHAQRTQTPDHSAAPHPPFERMVGSGESARTEPAGSPYARARAVSRDHWGPTLSGSRELRNSLEMPGTFLLWD